MNYALTFRLGLAAVLVASLSFKALFHEGRDPRQPAKLNGALSALFIEAHFAVGPRSSDAIVSLDATRDRCRVQVSEADPFGAGADAKRTFTVDDGDVRFIFRGVTSRDQPVLRGAASYLLNSVRQHLFLSYKWEPVLIAGASPNCPLDSMPWESVASFSSVREPPGQRPES